MDIATRYFTSRREDPTGTAVPFPANVDPKGILRSLAADDYFHGPDNEVLFYNMIKVDGANKNRWTLSQNSNHNIISHITADLHRQIQHYLE